MLIDFLQKLSTHRFLLRVVNIAFGVVNEKIFFEPLTRAVLDNLIWPLTRLQINNQGTAHFTLFLFLLFIVLIFLMSTLILLF